MLLWQKCWSRRDSDSINPLGASPMYSVKEQHGGCRVYLDTIAVTVLSNWEMSSRGESLHCCSCARLCGGGWGGPCTAGGLLEWNCEISISYTLLNRWYTNNIRTLYLGAWYLIYVTKTLWAFYFRETVKVTVRIFHKEKLLSRGEAAYHNVMTIPRAGDWGNVHPCWKKQPQQQTLTSCLNPWYDASHFSNYISSWMMWLNAYWAF